jgi:hypothetical protein
MVGVLVHVRSVRAAIRACASDAAVSAERATRDGLCGLGTINTASPGGSGMRCTRFISTARRRESELEPAAY